MTLFETVLVKATSANPEASTKLTPVMVILLLEVPEIETVDADKDDICGESV